MFIEQGRKQRKIFAEIYFLQKNQQRVLSKSVTMAVILFVVLSLLLKELEIETFQILYKVTFVKWSLRFVDS